MECFNGQFKSHQVIPDVIDTEPFQQLDVSNFAVYLKNYLHTWAPIILEQISLYCINCHLVIDQNIKLKNRDKSRGLGCFDVT
jgi:hypothetical protein